MVGIFDLWQHLWGDACEYGDTVFGSVRRCEVEMTCSNAPGCYDWYKLGMVYVIASDS